MFSLPEVDEDTDELNRAFSCIKLEKGETSPQRADGSSDDDNHVQDE